MRTFIAIALIATVFFSCTKESMENPLMGKWELRETHNTAATPATTIYEDNNGNVYEFFWPAYVQYAAGQATKSGTYTITRDTTSDGQVLDKLIMDGEAEMFSKVEGDILTLRQEGSAVTTLKFQRIE